MMILEDPGASQIECFGDRAGQNYQGYPLDNFWGTALAYVREPGRSLVVWRFPNAHLGHVGGRGRPLPDKPSVTDLLAAEVYLPLTDTMPLGDAISSNQP
jgi:hypothetical protein